MNAASIKDSAAKPAKKPRGKGKPFEPGQSGNPAGRPPGIPNKATTEIKERARLLLEDVDYQNALKQRLVDGRAGPIETELHHYAFGKPKEAKGEDQFSLGDVISKLPEKLRRELYQALMEAAK